MNRIINFANRNIKEIVRDPLSIVFASVLPLFLLFIFNQFNIPNEVYKLENFTPGIIIFSFSFITMFTATLVAKDRKTSLLIRLGISPMKPHEYILGYILSLIPLIILQDMLTVIVALLLGLKFSSGIVLMILISLIISILFISLGILIGSITTDKSSSGISSIIVQLVCFTSGMYFSVDMVGKTFKTICDVLPFKSSLNILKNFMNGDLSLITTYDILTFTIYTISVTILSCILFKKKMKGE